MQENLYYQKLDKERVDSYLASAYKDYSRSYFQKVAREQKIFVNGKPVLPSYKLKYNDIIIINKQPGIVVHPSYGHTSGTLLNAIVAHSKEKYNPYLVHRLDKDTSGLIVFAKNEKSKISISKQLQNRVVKKIYYAVVKGTIVENRGRIEAPLGRSPQNRKLISVNSLAKKMAITEFKVISRKDGYSLLEVRIITGRTHQIRSHMKYINHPVVGDFQYGGPDTINGRRYTRQMLHAYNITFTHPRTSKEITFTAPLPKDMSEIFKDK